MAGEKKDRGRRRVRGAAFLAVLLAAAAATALGRARVLPAGASAGAADTAVADAAPEPTPEPTAEPTGLDAAALEEFCEAQGEGFSVALRDLTSGESFFYNADAPYYGASTLKAPYALWLAVQDDAGAIDLDGALPNLYAGSLSDGWLAAYNTAGAIPARALVAAMIGDSDNQALSICAAAWPGLAETGYLDFATGLGMTDAFGLEVAFESLGGYVTAGDGLAVMQSLYNYFTSASANAAWLESVFCDADYTALAVPDGVAVAKKYGSWDDAFLDEVLVLGERPYILVCYTDWGDQEEDFPAEAVEVMQRLGAMVARMLVGG